MQDLVIPTNFARQIMAVKADATPQCLPSHNLAGAADVETELVTQLRAGDAAALEEMARLHFPAIVRLVHRLVGWSADAEDLAQDVFANAVGSIARFDGRSTLATWLTRIAINVCRTHHRRRIFRRAFWQKWNEPDRSASPDVAAVDHDRDRQVRQAVRSLPAKYREVIVLRYLQEMQLAEVAEATGLKTATVSMRLHRARQMLEWRLKGWMP